MNFEYNIMNQTPETNVNADRDPPPEYSLEAPPSYPEPPPYPEPTPQNLNPMSTILKTGKNLGKRALTTIADSWLERFHNEKQVNETRDDEYVTNLDETLEARKRDRTRDQFRSVLGLPTVTDDHEAGRLN